MKTAIGLNKKGQQEFIEWINTNYINGAIDQLEEIGWLFEFTDRLRKDSDARDYEMPGIETKTGNPVLFRFDDTMLEFSEIEDEF